MSEATKEETESTAPAASAPASAKSLAAEPEVPRSRLIGLGVGVFGFLASFLLMANDGRVPRGPLLGFFAILLGSIGVLYALDLVRPPSAGARPWTETWLGRLPGEPIFAQPVVAFAAAFAILLLGMVVFGYDGITWVILAALAALVPAGLRRPGLLVLVAVSAIYFPRLGVETLWDPWETHYGEVAREILARDDWISLWWAQEDWFWSKPILIFWAEAFTMGSLGVDYLPDANPAHPEWAVRLPMCVLGVCAIAAVYAAIARLFGRRAGALAALVLATVPQFFFLAHQAITDMALTGNMTIAVCFLVLALAEDPERDPAEIAFGRVGLSMRHVAIFALLVAVVPQALYLLSRNVTLFPGGFAPHLDEFIFGSFGNGDVPGNRPVRPDQPVVPFVQPALQGAIWLVGLGAAIWLLLREKRAQGFLMYGFYFFCALAFLGKGIPGFALPGLVALLFLVASKRWSLLLGGHLRIGAGALVVAIVGLPWYVAMYMRHGAGFTDRLLVHDHINRLAAGVHGDNGTIEYFLEQLGFGLFPWVGLALGGVVALAWLRGRSAGPSAVAPSLASPSEGGGDALAYHQRETIVLLTLWFFAAFALFSAMVTKFHHYIFPAVPPAAILAGLLLDRLFGRPSESPVGRIGAALAVVAPWPLAVGLAGLFGDVRGVVPADVPSAQTRTWAIEHPWPFATSATLVAVGLVLFAAAWIALRRDERADPKRPLRAYSALAIVVAAGAVVLAFVGRDLSWVTNARPAGFERLIHLYVYNYGRPWPDYLDYRPILTGFSIVATCLALMLLAPALARFASRAFVGIAIAFAAWTLNVYWIDVSPHWGMRVAVERYYQLRAGPEEPILAFQMNWKGENFYTGNRVHAFADIDPTKIRAWIAEHRGTRVFVMLEPGRLGTFRGLVPDREIHEHLTRRDNNKFTMISVEL